MEFFFGVASALALAGVVVATQHLTSRRVYAKRKVLVGLKTDTAFQGVLWARRGSLLVLRNAELVGNPSKPVDGEVVIERSDVEFVQVVA